MSKVTLPVAIGQTIPGEARVIDLAKKPHVLIAGATKQGKTNFAETIIASALHEKRPSDIRLVLIDPKGVELAESAKLYADYLAMIPETGGYITTPVNADAALLNLCGEMSDRYDLFTKASVHNIHQYNESRVKMPDILVVIDEYSDLVKKEYYDKERLDIPKRMMENILLLALKGGNAGIHLVLTTNRITKDVITALVKANFPTRIAFRVSSREESRIILDAPGAEMLAGNGDILLLSNGKLERLQGGANLTNPPNIVRNAPYNFNSYT